MEIFTIIPVEHTILSFLPYEDIARYALINRHTYKIWHNVYFWQQLAQRNFGISLKEFKDTYLSPPHRYLYYLTQTGHISRGSERFLSDPMFIHYAILQDREDLLKYYQVIDKEILYTLHLMNGRFDEAKLREGDMPFENGIMDGSSHNRLFKAIIREGRINVITFMLDRYPIELPPSVLINAAIRSKKSRELIPLILSHYSSFEWSKVFRKILQFPDNSIFDFMVEQWNQSPNDRDSVDWNSTYHWVFRSGSIPFIQHVLNKITSMTQLIRRPHEELYDAIYSNKLEVVKFVITSHPQYGFDYFGAMQFHAMDLEIICFIVEKIPVRFKSRVANRVLEDLHQHKSFLTQPRYHQYIRKRFISRILPKMKHALQWNPTISIDWNEILEAALMTFELAPLEDIIKLGLYKFKESLLKEVKRRLDLRMK